MHNREDYLIKITRHFSVIQSEIVLRNSQRLFDIDIHAEEFFKNVLNKLYNLNLENLNLGNNSSIAIDLGDYDKKIAFQITSNKSLKKVRDTVEKFYKNQVKDFNTLKILVLKENSLRHGQITHGDFIFDFKEDILDISSLIRYIQSQEISVIAEIATLLDTELNSDTSRSTQYPGKKDEEYFAKFLNSEIDPNTLLIKAQPNLADCKELFSNEYYRDMFSIYSIHYFSLLENREKLSDKLSDKKSYKLKISSYGDVQSDKHNLPGGFSKMFQLGALRPTTHSYYTISFVTDAEHGITFRIWVFINGRWVFFPKPWQVVDLLYELKNNKVIKRIVKILRFFRLNKKISSHDPQGVFATTYILKQLVEE